MKKVILSGWMLLLSVVMLGGIAVADMHGDVHGEGTETLMPADEAAVEEGLETYGEKVDEEVQPVEEAAAETGSIAY